MTFSRDTHWVWDFWLADDGSQYHLYYLHAPRSLGDERLRHRNARIGHATSPDLRAWRDHGPVLGPGAPDDFDASATWTGSVVLGPDGLWRMFYTGARFLGPDSTANVESIGLSTSTDLHTWTKRPGPIAVADPRWYETLADGTWREEAWRDPWVYQGADGMWHMLITARSRAGRGDDRGVVGHAVSKDLEAWTVLPPLSEPDAGFAHLEVPQLLTLDGQDLLVFSCDAPALVGRRAGARGGVWALPIDAPTGSLRTASAELVIDESHYAGRIARDRDGRSVLLAFHNRADGDELPGIISDPIPVRWDPVEARIRVETEHRADRA